jgi:hypothetical protein
MIRGPGGRLQTSCSWRDERCQFGHHAVARPQRYPQGIRQRPRDATELRSCGSQPPISTSKDPRAAAARTVTPARPPRRPQRPRPPSPRARHRRQVHPHRCPTPSPGHGACFDDRSPRSAVRGHPRRRLTDRLYSGVQPDGRIRHRPNPGRPATPPGRSPASSAKPSIHNVIHRPGGSAHGTRPKAERSWIISEVAAGVSGPRRRQGRSGHRLIDGGAGPARLCRGCCHPPR